MWQSEVSIFSFVAKTHVKNIQEYVSHPINAYMLMKRTTVIWQAAKDDILDPAYEKLWEEIEQDIKIYEKQEL